MGGFLEGFGGFVDSVGGFVDQVGGILDDVNQIQTIGQSGNNVQLSIPPGIFGIPPTGSPSQSPNSDPPIDDELELEDSQRNMNRLLTIVGAGLVVWLVTKGG